MLIYFELCFVNFNNLQMSNFLGMTCIHPTKLSVQKDLEFEHDKLRQLG